MQDTFSVLAGVGEVLQGCEDWATRVSPEAERLKARVRRRLETQKPVQNVGEEDDVT